MDEFFELAIKINALNGLNFSLIGCDNDCILGLRLSKIATNVSVPFV